MLHSYGHLGVLCHLDPAAGRGSPAVRELHLVTRPQAKHVHRMMRLLRRQGDQFAAGGGDLLHKEPVTFLTHRASPDIQSPIYTESVWREVESVRRSTDLPAPVNTDAQTGLQPAEAYPGVSHKSLAKQNRSASLSKMDGQHRQSAEDACQRQRLGDDTDLSDGNMGWRIDGDAEGCVQPAEGIPIH